MACIPFWKGCNRNVEYVDRSNRGLNRVPEEIQRYSRSLEELILDSNHIRELSKGFYRLCRLRKLTLSDNQIKQLSQDISNFIHLAELDISRNDLNEIPENIKCCKCLQTIDFSNNPLERLPNGLMELKSLTKLCLNYVQLTQLPAAIGNLKNLEVLELRDNIISFLPPSLSFLTSLRTLDLGGNVLQSVPEFIGSLCNLEELRLDCNDVSYLPSEIGTLKKLMQLDLSENCLEHLPRELGELTCLTDLLLSFNMIKLLPDGLGQLRKLCTLKLDTNQLEKLPPLIGGCHALQELILTGNELTELPPSIGRLKALLILNADCNKLTHLPPEIGNCHRLSVLSVRDNVIRGLPSEIGNLRQLSVLDVSKNQLHNLPLSLNTCDLKAIWLSESQAQPLIRFQQELDEETGEKVLTCFLLPQTARVKTAKDLPNTNDSELLDSSLSSNVTDSCQPSHNSVKFLDEQDAELREHSQTKVNLIRQSTPHPKDLQARHGRFSLRDQNSSLPDLVSSNNDLTRSSASRSLQLPMEISTSSEPLEVMHADDDYKLSTAFGNLSRDISMLSVANTESSATYDTARENLSDDTLTANDLSSSLDSDQDSLFNLPNGSDLKTTNSCSSSTSDINIPSFPPSIQTAVRIVRKPGTALGISIAGGRGSMPFIGSDDGIFISRVTPEGACDRAGVEVGDKVISVNGESFARATHRRAVNVLKNASNDILMFVIKADLLNVKQKEEAAQETDVNCCQCDRDVGSDVSASKNVYGDENCNSLTALQSAESEIVSARRQLKHRRRSKSESHENSTSASSGGRLLQSNYSTSQTGGIGSECSSMCSDDSQDTFTSEKMSSMVRNDLNSATHPNSHHTIVGGESTAQLDQQYGLRLSVTNVPCDHDQDSSCQTSVGDLQSRSKRLKRSMSDSAMVRKDRRATRVKCQQRGRLDVGSIASSGISSTFEDRIEGADRPKTQCPVEDILITKLDGTLGISIVGGLGQTSHPFGVDEPGVFVSKIKSNSPALNTSLRVGDRITSVNGKNIQNSTHQEAVDALVLPKRKLLLSVRHDPLPPGFQELQLEVLPGEKLGLTIQGGCGSVYGNEYDKTDEGIFISKIARNSAAGRDGRLIIGHRLLEANGCCLLGTSHADALLALQSFESCVYLTISDGYNNVGQKTPNTRRSIRRSSSVASSISVSEQNATGRTSRIRRVKVKSRNDENKSDPVNDIVPTPNNLSDAGSYEKTHENEAKNRANEAGSYVKARENKAGSYEKANEKWSGGPRVSQLELDLLKSQQSWRMRMQFFEEKIVCSD